MSLSVARRHPRVSFRMLQSFFLVHFQGEPLSLFPLNRSYTVIPVGLMPVIAYTVTTRKSLRELAHVNPNEMASTKKT